MTNTSDDKSVELNRENAINAYFDAIQALHKEGSVHKYTDYIVGDAKVNGRSEKDCQNPNMEESLADAHNFFVELDTRDAEQGKEYTEMRDSVLKDALNYSSFYSVMEGIPNPEISVAVAIAYVLFVDPEAVVYLEFLRDKWEYRGDLYKDPVFGGRWLYFCYCSEAPAGEVNWRYKNKSLTFEWEKKKSEGQRKREYEQAISEGDYDEVESLDLNEKKILFLIEYDESFKSRFRNEYKYVAGSMSYLFNYSCSFVGSIKAKPDYIIIDQNSVTKDGLQEAMEYKTANPGVVILELDRFVELLEKVDLANLNENKPSVTESDTEDEDSYGLYFDRSEGKKLKEAFEAGYFTDLEIIKAAKHISMPNDFVIEDKVFVFTGFTHDGEDKIKNNGGIIKKSVSGKTDYLVIDLEHSPSERVCAQANALFDKGKGGQLQIITPRILKQLIDM